MKKILIYISIIALLIPLAYSVDYTSEGCWMDDGCENYILLAGGDPTIGGSNATNGDDPSLFGWTQSSGPRSYNGSSEKFANGTVGIQVGGIETLGDPSLTYHFEDDFGPTALTCKWYWNATDVGNNGALGNGALGFRENITNNPYSIQYSEATGFIRLLDKADPPFSTSYVPDGSWAEYTFEYNNTDMNNFSLKLSIDGVLYLNLTKLNVSGDNANLTPINLSRLVIQAGGTGGSHVANFDSIRCWFGAAQDDPSTSNTLRLQECNPSVNLTVMNISIMNLSSPTESIIVDKLDHFYETQGDTNYSQNQFSFSNESTANFSLCMNNRTALFDFQLGYTWNDLTFTYFGNDVTFDPDSPILLDLFIPMGTSQITYTVKDEFDNGVEDAFITVEAFDIGTNTFSTVEILKTDSSGEAIGNAVLFTDWYRFTIKVDGETKLIDGPIKLGSTSKTFRVNLLGGDWYDKFFTKEGITHNLIYNNATKNFVLTWDDASLKLEKICLKVENSTTTGLVLVDDVCSTSKTGQIIINVGGSTDGHSYYAKATAFVSGSDADEFVLAVLDIIDLSEYFFYDKEIPGTGQMATFMVSLAMVFVGVWNPAVSIVLLVISFGAMRMLGIFYMGWGAFVAFIAIAGLLLYKLARSK